MCGYMYIWGICVSTGDVCARARVGCGRVNLWDAS